MAVPRWISRSLLVAAAMAAMAFGVNHTEQPCTGHQVGAAGMCVSTQVGGVL
ncbi:hypothetical protein [Micromonospora sp. L32]|uniref:hypothetical protein n=1 Tax=Micromonospora sp. L32 TaxID=3452214 RepID=UPI003F8B432C